MGIREKLSEAFRAIAQRASDNSTVKARVRQGRDEAGVTVAIWLVVAAIPISWGLTGYIYDGGNVREAQQMAYRTAEKAARLAADQLSTASLRSDGNVAVDESAAIEAGEQYLRAAGVKGTVDVETGGTVTVTAITSVDMKVLSGMGIDSIDVEETASAESINANTEPEDVR